MMITSDYSLYRRRLLRPEALCPGPAAPPAIVKSPPI